MACHKLYVTKNDVWEEGYGPVASLHPLVAAVINFPKMFVFYLIFDLKLSHVSH